MPLDLNFLAGTYFIEDDGIRGNNRSQIRGADGTIFGTFEHPADTLRFLATEPGVNFVFNFTDFLATSVVTVGDPDNAAITPESIVIRSIRGDGFITLASKGAITEGGSDTAADILGNAIVFSAATGVGTAGNALETETSFIEAETGTGGINLSNYGPLQIGNISSSVEGLDVFSSGNITVSTTGFFLFNDTTGNEVVHGGDISGNVTLSAIGADADMFTTVDLPVVSAAGGGVTLNVGRDIALGTSGTVFNNDVLATGDITINAGRDFFLDGTANLQTSAFGGIFGGDISITAGRNIALTDTSGGLQTIEAFLGNVVLTTGPGGTFTQDAEMNAVTSTGNITINADRAAINDGGIVAASGQVTIRPVSPGRAIDLGNPVDPASALALSNSELGRIGAQSLSIGDMASGPVTVGAALAFSFVNDVTVRSGTEILVDSSVFVQRNLALLAGDDVFVTPAGSITASTGGLSVFVDQAQDDGGLGGFGSLGGTLSAATSIQLTGNLDSDTLRGSSASDILDGRGGADMLSGGGGDDFFYVDNAGDVVVELASEGANDRIFASVSYTLAGGVEVERMYTIDVAATTAINLTGNEIVNIIYGNAGANTLDGAGGADTLIGLGGDDFYFIDNPGDAVSEGAGGGANDRIFSSVSYTQGAGVQVERLTTSDNLATTAINLTGNELANIVFGNAGANVLDGKAGVDTLVGLGGDDWFFVDNAADAVSESAGGGANDRVFASVSYTLGAGVQVERLTTSDNGATTAINLIGNELANIVFGNAGANILDGKGASDTLIGMAGADSFRFTTAPGSGNVDSISDYTVANDTIQLENAVFTGLAAGALAAGAFNTGAAASQADDRIIYNSATGALLFDADGVGGVAGVLFATVDTGLAMAASEFFVI